MIIADPDEIGGPRFLENGIPCRNGLKGLELTVELLYIFPAGRCIEFTDVVLNLFDGGSFQRRDLSKSFL